MVDVPDHFWNLYHSNHIDRSLPSQLSWKKSLFLKGQILGLLLNTLAADEKYPVLNRDNLTIPIQIQLHQKHKNVSQFFLAFLKSSWNFEHFGEKDYAHRFVFPKLRTTNAWSDKRLKSLVSDNHWTSNTGNVPNQCWNLHHIILIIFTHHFQVNLVGKSLCFWDTKSWDCLLTHWLPMKRILFLIETI